MPEWTHALKIISGGNSLISKRYPNPPRYFTKAKGCYVWDRRKYIDTTMSLGSVILGYCDPDVDKAVKDCINKGINTSLNCPEEVLLAEKLLELNPFADKVKFARTGGEAITIALRLAIDYIGKKKVAYNGYHGWHVNKGIKFKEVRELERVKDLGVILVELAREDFISEDFIGDLKNMAKKKKCVIIVDEITSGFRLSNIGVYTTYDLTPDIVVYGKAMGNGYAISALVGKRDIMKERSIISSTFWSERIGFTASLATIKKFQEKKVGEHIIHMSLLLEELGTKSFYPLSFFDVKDTVSFRNKMAKKGFLAYNCFFISYAHKKEHIKKFIKAVRECL